ncbi:MAG: ECF transporter S component [Acutalibacteraceae bacterium]|jgi:uncharacterized membrane protein
MNKRSKTYRSTLRLTVTALFMALTVIASMSVFSIPVPGGHLYVCDVVIVTAAILLDPPAAFCVGGIGSFLGDLLFYPAPMFVSLIAHGLQAVIISLFTHYAFIRLDADADSVKRTLAARRERQALWSVVGVVIGGVIMVAGYTLGRAFIYGPALYGNAAVSYSITKLPYELLQAAIGGIAGPLLCWKAGLVKLFRRLDFYTG